MMLPWLWLAGCDDWLFNQGPGGGGGGGGGWCGVTDLFDRSCTSCHSPGAGPLGDLDLETDPYAALVGVPSTYPGRTLVVASDAPGSFLLTKLEGTQTNTEGQRMPMGAPLSEADIDLVRTWIAEGATQVCEGTHTGDTAEPWCNLTNEECRPGLCDVDESPRMLPGADCLGCHRASGGEEEAPRFTAAGTAFVDGAGTAPLVGAAVHIVDDTGKTVDLTTNAAGNFYTSIPLVMPISASITADGSTLEMVNHPAEAGCNACHRCDGQAGAKLFGP